MAAALQFETETRSGSQNRHARTIDGAAVAASFSTASEDRCWDEFLQQIPAGQFQQSSLWARCKAVEGWSVIRCVFTIENQITGGFQMLWRRSRLGRIGYVSKGPVLQSASSEMAEFALELLCEVATGQKLTALIVQPPDESLIHPAVFPRYRFQPNHVHEIIKATLIVEVCGGMAMVERRMNQDTRKQIRQARKRGVVIRECGMEVVGSFFKMLLATCARQRQKPNPSSEAALGELWKLFRPLGARLTIARGCGEDVAGQLCIPFGQRVTLWKKGWSGQHKNLHPNKLLIYEALEWASQSGYKICDFASLDHDIAASLLAGKHLSDVQKNCRDVFNLGFGGQPKLLPGSRIWISNPFLRFGYKVVFARRQTKSAAKLTPR